ncbi:hypothetical protein [Bradyrhizobium sp. WSM2254]|uniref:hypothetical protein n=1 Tax=Bradyrhizobium sp. WSM2254 TaxID=1188263 RepID=UPI0003FD5817|nr:hypothetical protein [Bradyrhizobium sp. WSM2254]
MFVVIVETQIDAEERAGRTTYLAKLVQRAGGAVEEELGLEVVNCENRRALAMLAWPDEVFLARRWWQIGNQEGGGEVLFTVNGDGDIILLDHNEADALLVNGGAQVLATVERRRPPANVFCRPASLSGQSILRGRL